MAIGRLHHGDLETGAACLSRHRHPRNGPWAAPGVQAPGPPPGQRSRAVPPAAPVTTRCDRCDVHGV